MAQINARNVPDDLYKRVRVAAAKGDQRIAKGALQRFVIRALRRAVENPQPGAGLPKLKLCARCVAVNLEAVKQKKNTIVSHSADTGSISTDSTLGPSANLFADLLAEIAPDE